MQLTDSTFYVIQTPTGDEIVNTEDQAVAHLRDNGADIDPDTDDVTVAEISYDADDWTIKELPWQRIALQLLQER